MKSRRPEDRLTDEMRVAVGLLPGIEMVDLRHVGKFCSLHFEDGMPKYGPPITIGRKGQPDWLILVDGKALYVETKSAHGRLSEEQKKFHAALRLNGCPVVVCRTVAEVLAAIEARR